MRCLSSLIYNKVTIRQFDNVNIKRNKTTRTSKTQQEDN